MSKINLTAWGWNERVTQAAATFPDLIPARVISQEKGLYRIISANGEQIATVSGKFRFQAQTVSAFPTVGDFVLTESDGVDSPAVICELLPRTSVFLRKAAGTAKTEQAVAANVDTALICMSLNSDFNLRRLERYPTAAQ